MLKVPMNRLVKINPRNDMVPGIGNKKGKKRKKEQNQIIIIIINKTKGCVEKRPKKKGGVN
jgi:hypothetical protein